MPTYQLSINDDFSSTVVFGSIAPDNYDGVLGTDDPDNEPLEPTDGPTIEPGSFVSISHINLPNYNFLNGMEPVFRFQDDGMVEDFVKGHQVLLEELSGPIAANAEYPEAVKDKANIVRNQRNTLLMESDWTQAADSPLSDDDKAAWATYRANLRNLSDHANWPELLPEDWPTKP